MRFYIFNDLRIKPSHLLTSIDRKKVEFLEQKIKENPNVTILNPHEQITELLKEKSYPHFQWALGISEGGYQIGVRMNERLHLFTHLKKIEIGRKEIEPGSYELVSLNGKTIHDQLSAYLPGNDSLAVVDDTIFSGQTLSYLLDWINIEHKQKPHIFCLYGMVDSLSQFQTRCYLHIAKRIEGAINKEVSVIKLSGLFTNSAIRKKEGKNLAFFERNDWMEQWFPYNSKEIISLCREMQVSL